MNSMVRKWLGEDPEVARFRVWCGVFVLWCMSGVMSCGEIKYARSGETVIAERINASSSSIKPTTHATYQWRDSKTGERRKKVLETTNGFAPAQLDMQYVPGGMDSRPARGATWVMPAIFLGLTAAAIGWLVVTGIRDKRQVTTSRSRHRR